MRNRDLDCGGPAPLLASEPASAHGQQSLGRETPGRYGTEQLGYSSAVMQLIVDAYGMDNETATEHREAA
jgi:hypothetical protein